MNPYKDKIDPFLDNITLPKNIRMSTSGPGFTADVKGTPESPEKHTQWKGSSSRWISSRILFKAQIKIVICSWHIAY